MKKNKNNIPMIIGILSVILIGLVLAQNINTNSKIEELNFVEKDIIIGDINAPITITEFTDFECPVCKSFHTNTYPQLKEEFIDTGIAKIELKNFPLSFHPNAKAAAMAALCANDQDKAQGMIDMMFRFGVSGNKRAFKEYAKSLELNETRFNYCLDKNVFEEQIQRETQEGLVKGVTGTPSFIIDRELIVGAQNIEVFRQRINEVLTLQ